MFLKTTICFALLITAAHCSSVQESENSTSQDDAKSDDMWSMVASMTAGSQQQHETSSERKHDSQLNEEKSNQLLGASKFDWQIQLDDLSQFNLSWRVSYPQNRINFGLSIDANKFQQGLDIFALGFSQRGELQSSDFCLIFYDLGHRLHLQDAKTSENNIVELIDSSQSVCKLLPHTQLSSSQRGAANWPSTQLDAGKHLNGLAEGGGDLINSISGEAGLIDDIVGRTKTKRDEEVAEEETDDALDLAEEDEGAAAGREGAQANDRLEVVFKRPLDVCSSAAAKNNRSYYMIDDGTTHLVWFALRGPVLSIDGLNLSELASKNLERKDNNGFQTGMRRVQLIAHKSNQFAARRENSLAGPKKTTNLEIKMDKFHIPARETTYWCKLFKLPAKFESRKYHITGYESVIERANEHVVHHMELFSCPNLSATQEAQLEQLESSGGWAGECSSKQRPQATEACKRVLLAWALGARPLVYPDQVGQLVGGKDYSLFVMLEVHYNNVARAGNLVDSSGLRFHYTSRLRKFNAGVLEVGLEYTDKNSIPPKIVAPLAGHCVSECTRVAMANSVAAVGKQVHSKQHLAADFGGAPTSGGAGGIYIFAAQMHTHLAGVASWTEHVRQGKLLGELQRDNHYSPHFQEIRLLRKPVHLEPGDALIHYCLYDTSGRPNITLGGFATQDEMCVTYLHYYPKIDLEVCKSSVSTEALEEYFAYAQSEEATLRAAAGNKSRGGGAVSENYRSIIWSPRQSRELVEFYANAPLSVQCNRSDGRRWPGHWDGIEPTRLRQPLPVGKRPPYLAAERQQQVVGYRGRGFGRRHARCAAGLGAARAR